ncbi:DUF1771-domain-containing protein [Gyrodon lividus]|nr:DUF1771-domain-containing protein [Gyrodon lividus]
MLYLILGAAAVYVAYQALFADNDNGDSVPPGRSRPSEPYSAPPPARQVRQWHDDPQPRRVVNFTRRDVVSVGDSLHAKAKQEATQQQPVEDYTSLRAKAKQEGDLMSQCYQQSKEAHNRRDGARAKELSEDGKRHACAMESLNAKASAIVFKVNNLNKNPGEVDLHGLYVKEAISYSEKAILMARRRGDSEIRLIVGQGTHSAGGVSRLKPAIEEDLKGRGLDVEVDPRNAGVLIVQLGVSLW